MIPHLYQFVFGSQPHYVVACGFGDAEKTVSDVGYTNVTQILDLGPYIIVSAEADGNFIQAKEKR